MRMIPPTPYFTESQAEKIIFDKLRNSFLNQGDFYAFHSFNLSEHNYKRFGEIDFLIVCPYGLYVLEIKGGEVSCKEGIWQFKNRYGQISTKKEGPFKQAESALHSLMKKLSENLSSDILNSICRGYGVIFLDCKLPTVGMEWDKRILCDNGQHHYLELWLKKLFNYSQEREHFDKVLTSDQILQIVAILRPDFESEISLNLSTILINDEINKLTESQLRFIDIIQSNDRVICEGGAGTGKTYLALELAKRWSNEGVFVGFICHSLCLKNYLQQHYPMKNVVYSTLMGLKQTLKRQNKVYYDRLIIDEGQDLLTLDYLNQLDMSIDKGLAKGNWSIFLDINNQSGFFSNIDNLALERIYSFAPMRVPLKTNCRNTKIILEKIKSSLHADMGVQGAGIGIDIKEIKQVNLSSLNEILNTQLNELVHLGGLNYSQITVLAEDQLIQHISSFKNPHITAVDEYSIKYFPPAEVSLISVKNMKGLENDAIIFICADDKLETKKNVSYVAMSRAKSILIIIHVNM